MAFAGSMGTRSFWLAPRRRRTGARGLSDQSRRVVAVDRPDDAGLSHLERLAAGDSAAFDCLVRENIDAMLSVAIRLLRDGDNAEAVVAEIFGEVWRSGGRCVDPAWSLHTWLCGAVIARCRPEDGVGELSRAAGTASALQACEAASTPTLGQRLAALPWSERAAMVLSYEARLANEDIARALQITTANVEALLADARRRLLR